MTYAMANDFGRAGLSGAVGLAASNLFYGESFGNSLPLLGLSLPAPVLVGGCAAGASLITDAAHRYVLPHIPGNEKYANIESAALGIAASGLSTALLLRYAAGGNEESFGQAFLLGAGSLRGGDLCGEQAAVQSRQHQPVLISKRKQPRTHTP